MDKITLLQPEGSLVTNNLLVSESSPILCRQFGPAKPLAGGAGAGGRGLREADGVWPADLPRPPAGGVAVHRPAVTHIVTSIHPLYFTDPTPRQQTCKRRLMMIGSRWHRYFH